MLETKIDVKKTALLIIDMENGLIKAKEEPFNALTKMVQSKGVISNTANVVAAARRAALPLIFTSNVHRNDNADVVPTITDWRLQGLAPSLAPSFAEAMLEGTRAVDVVDELKPAPKDHVIYKRRPNAFYNSDLELMLRSQRIDTVIVTGVITSGCVAASVQGARERDLHVIVLSDCCAAMTPEDDDYFIKKLFPRYGRVRTSDEIIVAMAKAGA